MTKSYQEIRSEYLHGKLDEKSVSSDPFVQFKKWMNEAIEAKVPHPTSVILATSGNDNQPSARVVLLKDVTEDGFVFFTNYNSHKGRQLAENPKAGLTFFWMDVERQIRIEGITEKVSAVVSDQYFHSRPFESRLSAAVSPQSSVIENRGHLEKAKEELRQNHPDQEVPRPENWGGYLLKPHYFEFWQGRESRLHDRIIFRRNSDGWEIRRLAP
jgi:pyridoxamine 5'-phosphate oxidase